MDKGIFIRDIKDGSQVDGVFLVKEMSRAETRAGKPFLSLSLIDNSGEIAARIWDNAEQMQESCTAGTFVAVTGQGQAFRDLLQLKITSLRPVAADELDLALFLPASAHDPEEMLQELRQLIDSILDPPCKALLDLFFSDARFTAAFKKAPAAKNMHHAYTGGLLEHTLAVCRLVDACWPVPSSTMPAKSRNSPTTPSPSTILTAAGWKATWCSAFRCCRKS
ncbi:MAG: OB-fold nucleic acid binding domain-containing protein [Deltaproteobacteria bacterium]